MNNVEQSIQHLPSQIPTGKIEVTVQLFLMLAKPSVISLCVRHEIV